MYEYYIFFPDNEIVIAVNSLRSFFAKEALQLWFPFFFVFSALQLFMSFVLISRISRGMVRPIKSLRKRIIKSVNGIRNLRQANALQTLEIQEQNKMFVKL